VATLPQICLLNLLLSRKGYTEARRVSGIAN
jgi:hypothetical protein